MRVSSRSLVCLRTADARPPTDRAAPLWQALAASGEPQRQGETLLALLRVAAAGHGHGVYFGTVTAQCMTGTQHKLVRRLAYSFLRSCQGADGLAEWVMVSEAVLRDMRDQDPELAIAAMAIIPSLPLQVLLPSAANFALSLTAILTTRGDAASEGVRRAAVQGARHLLLRIGDVMMAAEKSDPGTENLRSLAHALAACALESSRAIASEAMEALAMLCQYAPASCCPMGASCLRDLLRPPNLPISVLENDHSPLEFSGSSAQFGGGACLISPKTRGLATHGSLGILKHLAASAVAWLQERFALLLARFTSLQVAASSQRAPCDAHSTCSKLATRAVRCSLVAGSDGDS